MSQKTNIIIKKVQKHLNVSPGGLTFGDVREQMSRDLLHNLTTVIERMSKHQEPYFVLVCTKIDPTIRGGHVIQERIILLDQMPKTRYLGSLLFRIDGHLGDAELVWCLPLDIPSPIFLATERSRATIRPGVTGIMESANGLALNSRGN